MEYGVCHQLTHLHVIHLRAFNMLWFFGVNSTSRYISLDMSGSVNDRGRHFWLTFNYTKDTLAYEISFFQHNKSVSASVGFNAICWHHLVQSAVYCERMPIWRSLCAKKRREYARLTLNAFGLRSTYANASVSQTCQMNSMNAMHTLHVCWWF